MRVNVTAFSGTWPWPSLCWSPHATKSGVSLLPRRPGLRISRLICVRRLRAAFAFRQATRTLCVSVASRSGRRPSKNQFAVCGQANVFGPSSNTYVLFVVVVTQNDIGDDPARTFKTEARVGSTVTEATKVYVDTLVRCYESGGPQNIMRGTAAPVPPMPSDMKTVLSGPTPAATGAPAAPAPAAQPQPSATAQAAPRSTPASGTVVMRQNGNIRIAPQGETIRVEPQGKELRVFGEAPGGWLQIGDTEANGWVHSSLVQRR